MIMNDGTMIESGHGTMVINDGEDDSTMKSIKKLFYCLTNFQRLFYHQQFKMIVKMDKHKKKLFKTIIVPMIKC